MPTQEKIMEFLKNKKVGVFCDDSNLYHGYQKYGWRINLGNFKELLKNSCDLKFIHYHIAVPDKSDNAFSGTQRFLSKIERFVTLKKKPIKYMPIAGKMMKKADVDVEIVIDVVRSINELDVAIIVSGDSDFLELKNYIVHDKKKSILFISYEGNMAWELRQCWHLFLNRIKDKVILK